MSFAAPAPQSRRWGQNCRWRDGRVESLVRMGETKLHYVGLVRWMYGGETVELTAIMVSAKTHAHISNGQDKAEMIAAHNGNDRETSVRAKNQKIVATVGLESVSAQDVVAKIEQW